jgi:hypothetical protein
MAQRSFLIPVSNALNELFFELMDTEDENSIWGKIAEVSGRHRKVLFYSKSFADIIDGKRVAEQVRGLRLGMFANMRPYLITEKETKAAVTAVDNLFQCENDQDIIHIFNQQCNRIYDFMDEKEIHIPKYEENLAVFDNVKKQIKILKGFRDAHQQNENVSIEVPRQTEIQSGIHISITGDTEMRVIQQQDIPWHYGELLGQTFGELCGLCYPSWWLGRNYWFGLLLNGELGTFGRIPYLGVRKFLRTHSEDPVTLFKTIKIEGFEKGFDINAPFNQLGYYFPAPSVSLIADGLPSKYEKQLHNLGKAVTNYGDEDIACCEEMVYESFCWASANQLGLVEGDDLVGWVGER